MTDEPDDALVRRLLAARRQPLRDDSKVVDDAWRLAAGEALDDEARRAVLNSEAGLRELALADAVLEARGRAHADAERSADAVLAQVRAVANRRSRFKIVASAVCALAAAVLLWIAVGRLDGGVRLVATDVVASRSRSGGEDGFTFRLTLQPAQPAAVAVWLLLRGAEGVDVQRLHPLLPSQVGSPAFAGWPSGPLPNDRVTTLPPARIEPFAVPGPRAFVVVATLVGDAEATIAQLQERVRAAAGTVLDDAMQVRVLDSLREAGVSAEGLAIVRP